MKKIALNNMTKFLNAQAIAAMLSTIPALNLEKELSC